MSGGHQPSLKTPGERLFDSLLAARVKLVCGVPDGMLADTIMRCSSSADTAYIACAREEECIGVASGAALAGVRAAVLVQNAGLLNSLGAFATMGMRYQLPFVVFTTNRGALADPNAYDIEKYDAFEACVTPYATVFRHDFETMPDDIAPAAFKWAEAARRPLVVAFQKSLGAAASQ